MPEETVARSHPGPGQEQAASRPNPLDRLAEAVCYRIAHALVARRDAAISGREEEQGPFAGSIDLTDRAKWYAWRARGLRRQFEGHFDPALVRGKDVLDFGCGGGALAVLAADLGARSVVGVDLREDHIAQARDLLRSLEGTRPVEFVVASAPDRVDFEDERFDVILCFDVLEHIMRYEEIISEWRRILRPGGRVLIWWQPYYHPYGHHLQVYIPIPWAHVLFPRRVLARVCSRILRSPAYRPRFWDLDEHGRRLVDREFRVENLGGVNRLTIAGFERLCRRSGLRIVRRQPYPFRGPLPVRAVSRAMTRVPGLREFFTAYMIYEIERA